MSKSKQQGSCGQRQPRAEVGAGTAHGGPLVALDVLNCGHVIPEMKIKICLKNMVLSPGRSARLVGVWSRYTEVADSIPGQGTHKNHRIIDRWDDRLMFLSKIIKLNLRGH